MEPSNWLYYLWNQETDINDINLKIELPWLLLNDQKVTQRMSPDEVQRAWRQKQDALQRKRQNQLSQGLRETCWFLKGGVPGFP